MMSAGQKRNYQIWLAICLLMVLVCTPFCSHADQTTYEGPGWDTPEDAVLVYLEGMKEQDLYKMISAYAVETHIDHFDLQAQLERIRAYTISMIPRMPNSTNLLWGINVEARKNEIVQSILLQMSTLCLYERAQDFDRPIGFQSDNFAEEARAFVEELDQAFAAVDFNTLNVLRFTPPELISELYASERNQENIKRQAAPYGVDEMRSVIAVFALDDKVGALCCDVARYGDRWFMHKPGGNIAAIIGFSAMTGGVIAGPVEEMAAVLDSIGLEIGDFLIDVIEQY